MEMSFASSVPSGRRGWETFFFAPDREENYVSSPTQNLPGGTGKEVGRHITSYRYCWESREPHRQVQCRTTTDRERPIVLSCREQTNTLITIGLLVSIACSPVPLRMTLAYIMADWCCCVTWANDFGGRLPSVPRAVRSKCILQCSRAESRRTCNALFVRLVSISNCS
jgi:hypothetical protein